MSKEVTSVLPLIDGTVEVEPPSKASERWMRDLGEEVERLAYMLRKPTDVRPFVYEVRFDLLPVQSREAKAILKGFGAEGSLCAFVNGTSFLGILRQTSALLEAGKLKWYADQYAPSNYGVRVERYNSGEFYLK